MAFVFLPFPVLSVLLIHLMAARAFAGACRRSIFRCLFICALAFRASSLLRFSTVAIAVRAPHAAGFAVRCPSLSFAAIHFSSASWRTRKTFFLLPDLMQIAGSAPLSIIRITVLSETCRR